MSRTGIPRKRRARAVLKFVIMKARNLMRERPRASSATKYRFTQSICMDRLRKESQTRLENVGYTHSCTISISGGGRISKKKKTVACESRIDAGLYGESQVKAYCGVHAVNAIFNKTLLKVKNWWNTLRCTFQTERTEQVKPTGNTITKETSA
jgi:hypothetical protein